MVIENVDPLITHKVVTWKIKSDYCFFPEGQPDSEKLDLMQYENGVMFYLKAE